MKIGQTGINQVQNQINASRTARNERADRADAKSRGVANADDLKAEISSRAKDAAMAKDIATKAPDVREQKIAQLKKMIAEGRYERDAKDVADRMVDDHLGMRGIS